MPARPRRRDPRVNAHPLEHTTASVMLAIAVDASDRTMTEIGLAAGYGASNRSSLSQMANGMAPIPLDAAERLAAAVGLDTSSFTVATLHQRHPEAAEALFALEGMTAPPLLPQDLLVAMRERLKAGDVAFARAALPTVAAPHPWTDAEERLRSL